MTTNQIALIWTTNDVQETRPDLTDEQCMKVLLRVQDKHDACEGVCWETLEINADYLYPLHEKEEN